MTEDVTRKEVPALGCVDPKQGLVLALMAQSIHEYVVSELQATKGSWPEVAEGSGVSLRTLEKVARREYKTHRFNTLEALYLYFQRRDRKAS